MKGTLHEDRYTLPTISRSVLLRMKSISDKIAEKLETHILCSVTFYFDNRSVCGRIWINIVEWGQATNDKMALALTCCIPIRWQIQTQIV
jgi:hypothetical protein